MTAALRSAIGDPAHISSLSRNRPNLNDATTPLFDHVTGSGLCREEGACEIDTQDAFPILQARIECQLVQCDARIVDDIDAAEPPHRFRNLPIALNRIGDVGLKGLSRTAELCDG
jgi:hypothetical protein